MKLVMKSTFAIGMLALALSVGIASAALAQANAVPEWSQVLESAERAFLSANQSAVDSLLGEALKKSPDDTARGAVQNQIGVIRLKQRRYADAQSAFNTALELRKKELGPTHELTLQTLSNLALAVYKMGDEKRAEQLYKEAIGAKRKIGPNSESLAISLTNLAHLYGDQHRCIEAKQLYVEALDIDTKSFGDKSIEAAGDLFNIGALFHRCNQITEAVPYFERAQAAYSGANDKYGVIKSLHYLSLSHAALKRHDKALDASMQALQLHEQLKGKENGDTLVHLLNAADALDASGKDAEAEALYKRALEAAEHANPISNLRLTECNLELAQFYKNNDKLDQAEHYFKRAIVHYEHLDKREKRGLYELPLAYSKLLSDQKRNQESDNVAKKYLHVYAPGQRRQ